MVSFYWSVVVHKFWVCLYIGKACWALTKRALSHDLSKFSNKESKIFAKTFPNLRYSKYGKKSYDKLLDTVKPAIAHHYAVNSHHPEHYTDGIRDMSILDQLEMICDWAASVKKHKEASLAESLDINAIRFNYTYQYKNNLKQVIEEIGL